MSEWKRTTREVAFENLSPVIVEAVMKHVEQYNLGPILSDALMCIQTDSEKIKKPLFGSAEIISMGVVVTARWLVWAVLGTKTQIAVLSAQLSDVAVQDYAQTQFAKMIPDSGIQISGRFTDVAENGSAFIGLDESSTAHKFKGLVIRVAQDAKK